MKSLAVRVLGDFGVDGVEPQAIGSRKARLALLLLALAEGQVVPSDVLIDALWADAAPTRPDDQLAVLMSRLRSVLGRDRIEHRDHGYVLRCDWLDAAELAMLTDEVERRRGAGNVVGAAAAARVALSLLRGSTPVPVSGEWAQLRQAGLERLASRGRLAAATALLEAGDWVAAADAAAAALERDPYEEAALRVLLRAYVMGGQAAAALAAYASARERLADELGTDPSPETTALYTAILRGEVAMPAPLPASAAMGLVGRDDELAYLDVIAARARGGSVEVAVVDGEAGIGKTALLRTWAGRRAAAGDTVLMASCGQLDRAMPLDALLSALTSLLRRLGPEATADLMGTDAPMLEPLLGAAPGPRPLPELADSVLGPAVLYAALARVLGRLGERGPVMVVIDDAHLAGPALTDWLRFVRRGGVAVAVVAAVRHGEGEPLPATAFIHLDVLGREAATELVGPARVDELYARSKGHPLFLTELAQQSAGTELPASLLESVSARCAELGTAGVLLRTAAVIGPELDLDLLAAVLGRGAVELLDDAERAAAKQFLVEEDGTFRFRHELVREALAASATAGRAALLHRQAGRVLARRPAIDPATVAYHARLGGDLVLASQALADAAARAAERFDHAAAEALLDDALSLHPDPESWLARARVRTRRGHYREALSDVELAAAAGPAALEVGAWGSYFGRQFAQAAQFAQDGALAAADTATRARCLAVGGRTRHAAGDLAQAELLLGEAFSLAEGTDRVSTAAWLGVLRTHQSRVGEALSLLRPAARGQVGVEHTSATLHSLLFTGHAHALAGAPALALAAFARYTTEVERRQVPRFAGRAVNFAGWVLRNLGAGQEALDQHCAALELAPHHGGVELRIAALEDIAEWCVDAGDVDGARSRLAQVLPLLRGDLVFGWRLEMKYRLIAGRLALLRGEAEQALADASELESRAAALGVPRYASVARLLRHRASLALGQPVDAGTVAADLDLLDASVAIEAWWWTGDLAADFANPAWLNRAADRADQLARHAGGYADGLRRAAEQRLVIWRAAVGLSCACSAGREHHRGDHQGPGAGDDPFRCAPQCRPARHAQRANERRDVGHAQPPGRQLCRGRQPGRDGDGAQAHAPEAGRRCLLGKQNRVTRRWLDVLLEPHVPPRGAVAVPAELLIDRCLGRVGPARRERAGGDGPAHPPCLAQARRDAAQVAEAERGHD
jgi:DNA-binding SARP family transcriptional activator